MNFLSLRDKPDSQYEIQELARAIKELVKEQLPTMFRIWEEEYSG
jgi:thymidylate synthase ThyX